MRVCQFRHTRKMQKTPKNSVSFAKLEHFRTLPNCPVADKAGHSRTLNYLRASKMVTGGHIRAESATTLPTGIPPSDRPVSGV